MKFLINMDCLGLTMQNKQKIHKGKFSRAGGGEQETPFIATLKIYLYE
jgi:hypothetical protein